VPRTLEQWFRHTRGPLTAAEQRDVGKPIRHPEVSRSLAALRRLGVRAPLEFRWSDDGSGVEEDRPHIVFLIRSLPRADRAPAALRDPTGRIMSLGVAGVVRHEIGHSLLFLRPRDARRADFIRLFGDVSSIYRVGDPVTEVLRRLHRNRGLANPRYRREVSLYAATHPHERFAEAFRIALALHCNDAKLTAWANHHQTHPIVLAQLHYAASWLRSYH
jgi:hypothetical protein